ncbi:MAG TPA: dodecin family protein [Tichowtungia sp.]|nr:dodecin family protein [Tichowtungia sp.]
MSHVLKVVEILSESEKSWEAAAQNAVKRSSETLNNIQSVYIKEMSGCVENGEITSFRVNAKVTFCVED